MRSFQDTFETHWCLFKLNNCTFNIFSKLVEAEIEMHVIASFLKSAQLQTWIGNSQLTESEILERLIIKGVN